MTNTQEQPPEWAAKTTHKILDDFNLGIGNVYENLARALETAKAEGVREERERCIGECTILKLAFIFEAEETEYTNGYAEGFAVAAGQCEAAIRKGSPHD